MSRNQNAGINRWRRRMDDKEEQEPVGAEEYALKTASDIFLHPNNSIKGAGYHLIKILDVIGLLAGAMVLIVFGFFPLFDIYISPTSWIDKSAMMMYSTIFWSGVLASYSLSLIICNMASRKAIRPMRNDMASFSFLFSWISFLLLAITWGICLYEERQEKRQEFEDKLMGR